MNPLVPFPENADNSARSGVQSRWYANNELTSPRLTGLCFAMGSRDNAGPTFSSRHTSDMFGPRGTS
jgi:hypothetical protein